MVSQLVQNPSKQEGLSFQKGGLHMSTTTLASTLTINAAFLEEIKDSNVTLWRRLSKLRDTCEGHEVRPVVLHRLVGLLNEIRDLLALQFALEESYGYQEIPTSTSAHESTKASHLNRPQALEQIRGQHCALYLTINDLTEQAEELQYRGFVPAKVDDLVRQVRQFDLQLQDHERAERHMLRASRLAASRPTK